MKGEHSRVDARGKTKVGDKYMCSTLPPLSSCHPLDWSLILLQVSDTGMVSAGSAAIK